MQNKNLFDAYCHSCLQQVRQANLGKYLILNKKPIGTPERINPFLPRAIPIGVFADTC
jgi:hypothetical protein